MRVRLQGIFVDCVFEIRLVKQGQIRQTPWYVDPIARKKHGLECRDTVQ